MTAEKKEIGYKAIIFRRMWYWHKDRPIGQWTRTENTEIHVFMAN